MYKRQPASAPVPVQAPYIPFSAGNQQTTPSNDGGGGNAVFLDRHNIDCGNQPLNRLHYSRTGDNTFQYQFTCANGGQLGAVSQQATPFNDEGNGNTIYLDRHNADCGSGNVMTKLHLNRSGNGMYQWQFACAPNTQPQPLNCRQTSTGMNNDGGGNSIFLDRHDIQCNSNEALSQIHLQRNSAGNQYQFEYTCCS